METINKSSLKDAADEVLRTTVEPKDGTEGVPGVIAMATDREANIYEVPRGSAKSDSRSR